MKPTSWLSFIAIFFSMFLQAQVSRDYAVPLQAVVSEKAQMIELRWAADTAETGYLVFKRNIGENNWGNTVANLPASVHFFTDMNVTKGKSYEYYVQRTYNDPQRLSHGYVYAGLGKSIESPKGWLLLLVDANYTLPLRAEIEELKLDLVKDGWVVEERAVSRTATPVQVKVLIQLAANSRPNLQSIYLLGHIPVPYSGGFEAGEGEFYPPDGHEDHGGAWPSDLYYGNLTEGLWTDHSVNKTSPVRVQNQNIPGDGKFDRMYLGDDSVVYEIGRVDLTNLPAFALNDTLLTQQYLHKVHAYKMAQIPVYKAGLIDDNFGAADGEAFASAAWNDFTACFGDSVVEGDYVTELKQHPYLMSYGCGFGNYSSCFGVVSTSQFVNDSLRPLFTFLFGSYFGDWDSENNLLRAALANPTGGLASAWSGRPYWHLHPMALGKTMGYCTRLTQNNYFMNGTIPHGYADNSYPTFIHISLMGDPSLRLFMRKPMPAVSSIAANDSLTVTVNWQPVEGATGYYLSKTTSLQEGFKASIELPATVTTWKDLSPYSGYTKYMVRPIYAEQTASGTFYNTGLGSIDSAYSKNTVGLTTLKDEPLKALIYPNPSDGNITIQMEQRLPVGIEVFNLQGKSVFKQTLLQADETIDIRHLDKGYYIVKLSVGNQTGFQKLILY